MRFESPLLAVDWERPTAACSCRERRGDAQRARRARGRRCRARRIPEAAAAIRARFGDWPMLMAGTIGSTLGWRDAPYVPAPVGVEEIARGVLFLDHRTAIVPGVSTFASGRADVMRGEEVQALGAVAAGPTPPDALLCHPGTHCKWVRLEGRIADFTTAMTGELFALLRSHSVLKPQLTAPVVLGDTFLAGVAEGRRRDLSASLFGVRAAKLLGVRDDADAASFASGLVIGGDVAARLADLAVDTVYILAEPALAVLYAAAIEAHGRRAVILDGDAAFVAGIIAIGKHLS